MDRDVELASAVGDAADHPDARTVARVARLAASSARAAGAGAVVSGRWLAERAVDAAGQVRVRSGDELRALAPELDDAMLAGELVRRAGRVTAAVGAATGALVGVQELHPPAWLAVPAELVAETLVIAVVEMKLVAELHEVYGRSLTAMPSWGLTVARAWAEGRGVRPSDLARPGGLSEALGQGARRQVVRVVRRRLLGRMGRSMTALAPLLAGAIAGAEVNRRGTVALGNAVVRDLAASGRRPAITP